MANASRDGNFVPTALGVSSVDGITPVPFQVNPVTGRLLTDIAGGGSGTVTSVSVVTANGVSGSVATATTTPAITLTLGSITPSAVQVSGLTASQILSTDGSKNLTSLDVATYPSLLELSYVKGVTSSLQTQINAKGAGTVTAVSVASANGVSGSSSGGATPALTITLGAITPSSVQVSGLSVSQAVVTDGSKNLASLAYTSLNTGSTITSRDANGNSAFNNIVETVTILATSGQTITMNAGSARLQQTTGTLGITYKLPDATTLFTGQSYEFNSDTTGVTTIQNAGAGAITTVPAGGYGIIVCTNNSTVNGVWDAYFLMPMNASFGTTGLAITGTLSSTSTLTASTTIELGNATDTTLSRVSAGVAAVEGNNIVTNTSSPTLATITTTGDIELGNASDTTIHRNAAGLFSVESEIMNGFTSTATAAGTTTMDNTYTKIQEFTGTSTQTVKLPTTGIIKGQQYIIQNTGTTETNIVTVQSSGANTILILAGGCTGIFTATQAAPTTAAHWKFQKLGRNSVTATSYTTDTGTSLNCDYWDDFVVTAQAGALKLNNPTGTPRGGQNLRVFITGTSARAITYDTQFEASTVALPSTTVTTACLFMIFKWRADTSKWSIIGTA